MSSFTLNMMKKNMIKAYIYIYR